MASGSQMKSGNWADLPAAPQSRPSPMAVAAHIGMWPRSTNCWICGIWKLPTWAKISRMAR
ncbi:MAG: hypothetical protein A3J82_01150 [Elusimicrobia bacterium RIFOXYA2_FULL_69_6]|nr:MAG: hypothetical protein A3J82_01150 [Elusimicrobia bacterium RIFOXYA2_FULL_69_6]